jgi:hypothetical protein
LIAEVGIASVYPYVQANSLYTRIAILATSEPERLIPCIRFPEKQVVPSLLDVERFRDPSLILTPKAD